MNTYYYYCRSCCCRWWHLLLGLPVLRPSISSLLQSRDKCYYKVRQLFLLQSAMVCYYKVWQLFYYKVRQVLLQSATGITKCDSFITKCHDYYKVRQYRQYSVKNQLPSEKEENLWRIFGKSRVKNYFQHQSLLAEFLKSSRQLLKLKTVWNVSFNGGSWRPVSFENGWFLQSNEVPLHCYTWNWTLIRVLCKRWQVLKACIWHSMLTASSTLSCL